MGKISVSQLPNLLNSLIRKTGFQFVRVGNPGGSASEDGNDVYPDRSDGGKRSATSTGIDTVESRLAALEARTEETISNLIRYAMKAHWRTVDLIEQISQAETPKACPICDHSVRQSDFKEVVSNCIFHGGRLIRHQCPNCDVIFGPQKMLALDAEMLDLDYRNLYRIYSESNSTMSVIRTFKLLDPRKDGVYLDFGCGGAWSEAIEVLRAEGWNIYGYEPSVSQSSQYVFSRWDELEDKKFDGILSHNVLEHLFDPIETNRRLQNLLKESGRIVHATPCFDYLYEFTHYHVFFFTGRSADLLAEKAGLRIVNRVRDGEFIACTFEKSNQPVAERHT